MGKEICNAYTELNDPVKQLACFTAQAQAKAAVTAYNNLPERSASGFSLREMTRRVMLITASLQRWSMVFPPLVAGVSVSIGSTTS